MILQETTKLSKMVIDKSKNKRFQYLKFNASLIGINSPKPSTPSPKYLAAEIPITSPFALNKLPLFLVKLKHQLE